MTYKTSDFTFELPQHLIAQKPLSQRDQAKLLICDQEKLSDGKIKDLPNYLREGDVIVLNDTKVIKARLAGKNPRGANVTINLSQLLDKDIWQTLAKPSKRLKIGEQFKVSEAFYATVLGKEENGMVNLQFNIVGQDFLNTLDQYGQMPLPPYIKREQEEQQDDTTNYQTIYAKTKGAVAAPTAGLHFTSELFTQLEKRGVQKAFVTLQVGAGTFLPVKAEYITNHQMHSEYFNIDEAACLTINAARKRGNKIIAVGTTSLRVLESVSDSLGYIEPASGHTKIFIYPPYKFKMVDILLTNFHLPKSTLFMLVCAFIGKQKAYELYEHAIRNSYRFYSYGDACLLFKNP